MHPLAPLLGKYWTNLYISADDQHQLMFLRKFQDKVIEAYILDTEADCCSETWFADIVGVENLLKSDIKGIELLYLNDDQYPDTDSRSRQEYDRYYGFKLLTDKGTVEVVYRNSSNGYYGGELAMFKGDSSAIEWEELVADYPTEAN